MTGTFRVSRYDPALRDRQGRYTGSEWTSVSDIGRVIGGRKLTVAGYREVEDRYVRAAVAFASCTQAPITLLDLEDHGGDGFRIEGLDPLPREDLTPDTPLTTQALARVTRLCLREVIWCRIESSSGFYLHFGYDYLMYLGGSANFSPAVQSARADGLYVERMRSPYG